MLLYLGHGLKYILIRDLDILLFFFLVYLFFCDEYNFGNAL